MDKSKPYGVVYGHPEIRYIQDDIYYRADGTPIHQTKPEKRAYVRRKNVENGDKQGERGGKNPMGAGPVH